MRLIDSVKRKEGSQWQRSRESWACFTALGADREGFPELPNPRFSPLQTLIEQVLKSPYPGAGLQAVKSMKDLLLGMNSTVMDEPFLRIHDDSPREEFLLAYPGAGFEEPDNGAPWVRRVSTSEQASAVLERFLTKRDRGFQVPQK